MISCKGTCKGNTRSSPTPASARREEKVYATGTGRFGLADLSQSRSSIREGLSWGEQAGGPEGAGKQHCNYKWPPSDKKCSPDVQPYASTPEEVLGSTREGAKSTFRAMCRN